MLVKYKNFIFNVRFCPIVGMYSCEATFNDDLIIFHAKNYSDIEKGASLAINDYLEE